MHPYSTDESRIGVYGWIAVASVAIAWAITTATSALQWPAWLISVPSLAAVYAGLFKWFDAIGWKLGVSRALRLSTTPDVAGRFEGRLTSRFQDSDGNQVARSIQLDVQQTWTHMTIRMSIGDGERSSSSRSVVSAITREGRIARLVYYYKNQINPSAADEDMGDHDGAAELEFADSGKVRGRYFNSRPRSGSIEAQRK